MKPADAENRNERKLFIGQCKKDCNEEAVRNMFNAFGHIEECTVLRDANGQSKGKFFLENILHSFFPLEIQNII